MKQHTLAATYLKGFVSPDCPPGYEPFLYVHNVARRTCKARAPANVSGVPNYYSWRDGNGVLRHEAEQILCAIETAVTPILRHAIPSRHELSEAEQADLATFVTTTTWRVPARHDGVKDAIADGLRKRLEQSWRFLANNPRTSSAFRERMLTSASRRPEVLGGPCGVDELMQMLLDPRRIDFVPKREVVVGTALDHGLTAARKLLERGWAILTAPNGSYFVTTDRPGTMLGGGLPGVEPDPEDAWFLFPLSRDHCLLAARFMRGRTYRDITEQDVALMNSLAIQNAAHVFSPSARFLGDDQLHANRSETSD